MKKTPQPSTSIVLVTGYLGAGKTTRLKHLLQTLPKELKAAALINETAQQALDGDEIHDLGYPTKQLSNGCICCSKQDDLQEELAQLIQTYQPEIVFIETTGLAHPQPLINFLETLQTPTQAILTVVDAKQYQAKQQLGKITRQQIRHSNIIAISKTDLVEDTKQLQNDIQQLHPQATILTTKPIYTDIQNAPKLTLQTQQVTKTRHTQTSITIRTNTQTQTIQHVLHKHPEITRAKGYVQNKRFHYAAGLYSHEITTKQEPVIVLIGAFSLYNAIQYLYQLRPNKNAISYYLKHVKELIRSQQ